MIISAIYFKDENYCHLKIVDRYSCYQVDHLLVNGQVIRPDTEHNYVVEGKELKVQVPSAHTVISHYMNRETEETMPVSVYDETIESFMRGDGEYKDLESEYMCRKMQQTYIPVRKTYYEYTDTPVVFEEAEYRPDAYCVCAGKVYSHMEAENKKHHFIYSFDKWKFANDAVKRLMEEYGIQRVNSSEDIKTKEYYILHDEKEEYKWLELCGSEYFINYDDMFGGARAYDKGIIYGTYKEVLSWEQGTEQRLRTKIEYKLDQIRTVSIRKSWIEAKCDALEKLMQEIDNKKLNRREISSRIWSIKREMADLLKKK